MLQVCQEASNPCKMIMSSASRGVGGMDHGTDEGEWQGLYLLWKL